MSSNRFRFNFLKTQFIWLCTHHMAALATAFPHFVFSSVVRDLGVTLDQELTYAPHIHSLSRACYYQLRQLRTIARSLSPTATAFLYILLLPCIRFDY